MLLTEKDTSIQEHLTEMLTVKCGTVMGEAYSATSELFNGVETPNITWYDTPIEFEMKYEIAEKS